MKTNDSAHAGGMSLTEFNKLVRETAIREGKCIPETEEELQILEENLKEKDINVPEFSEAMRLLQAEEANVKTISFAADVDEQLLSEFALAARNGGEIPKEIRKKMIADRRREQRKKEK